MTKRTANAAKSLVSIFTLLAEDAPTTINAKLTSGDLITNAHVLSFAANGVKIFDVNANLIRYLNEWNTVYISTVVPVSAA